MRLIHTSDWQIGKVFRFADDDVLPVLQHERLEAISRIGRLARAQGADAVVVAGDIYDYTRPAERTLRQPIERMRQFPDLRWHLIPGNHDFHEPDGLWDRLLRTGLPDTILPHLSDGPAPLDAAGTAWVIPAGLGHRHVIGDPTAGMDRAATPEGTMRVGLAHGSVRTFGEDAPDHNVIAIDRARQAGLSYLALGDWHGALRIDSRTWYSGTPEVDGFDVGGAGGGQALLVTLDGPRAEPVVEAHEVGRFRWWREQAVLTDAAGIEALDARLRAIDRDDPSRVLVRLAVSGALNLADLECYQARIVDGLGSALRLLRIDGAPGLAPSPDDLDGFGLAGAVRAAADALVRQTHEGPEDGRDIAAAALQRLYLLARAGDPQSGGVA
ncbi:metallophosphoesterase [Gluconacetobacter diazotrophicus PA1 5]|uniref:metallophosphoesterase family protein n=1 Tax=Gluconacetobacter diazotrophicus TaxID=33996 RepID=UPI000173CEA1|nr:metallophosphoesterase [Gluconacetobacter diazotrophicus]ACI51032.1 metallophosphoesterase [Gluconacetobacter diazotrophicus PA1 5]TWB08513.1 DNA repair exonuclease SbcCD nuclease subunit [Gluconacetobacter diazotrophicus]